MGSTGVGYEPGSTYCAGATNDYTSARLDTRPLHGFRYGRIEARIKGEPPFIQRPPVFIDQAAGSGEAPAGPSNSSLQAGAGDGDAGGGKAGEDVGFVYETTS